MSTTTESEQLNSRNILLRLVEDFGTRKFIAVVFIFFLTAVAAINCYYVRLYFDHHKPEIEIIAFCADSCAIFLAGIAFIKQEMQLRRQEIQLAQQETQLEKQKEQLHEQKTMIHALSTHSIGWFPQHLRDVAALVERCETSLDILGDGVDYGSFFDPAAQRDIFGKIISIAIVKQPSVNVRMIVCGNVCSLTRSSPFFGKTLTDLKSIPAPELLESGTQCFDYYLKRYLDNLQSEEEGTFRTWMKGVIDNNQSLQSAIIESASANFPDGLKNIDIPNNLFTDCLLLCETEENGRPKRSLENDEDHLFHTLLLLRHEYFKAKLKAMGVTLLHSNVNEAHHFWLRDDQEAFFTFATAGKKRGRGFITRDTTITQDTFAAIFANRLKDAIEF